MQQRAAHAIGKVTRMHSARPTRLLPRIFRGFHDEDIDRRDSPLSKIIHTPDLIRFHGYECEEHVTITADGYFLVLHRILPHRKACLRTSRPNLPCTPPQAGPRQAVGPPLVAIGERTQSSSDEALSMSSSLSHYFSRIPSLDLSPPIQGLGIKSIIGYMPSPDFSQASPLFTRTHSGGPLDDQQRTPLLAAAGRGASAGDAADGIRPGPPSAGQRRRGTSRPPVLMLHGAMLSSEVWVCQPRGGRNFALQLVDAGYDVWLGNRRGNKYSQKHRIYKPHEEKFWDYSMDETIYHDLPSFVDHILTHAPRHEKVSLVGFSQGTAEALAALSISSRLEEKIACLVALSATAKPLRLTNSLVRSMIHWTPELVFLLFGRRSMMPIVYFWQSLLAPKALVYTLDKAMGMLFDWDNKNIRQCDKTTLYRHLYSQTSVKTIAHWFQIMRAQRFQMFDDVATGEHVHVIPEYPIQIVRTPAALFCGTKDTLIDIEYLCENMPKARIYRISGYEHMDPLWAADATARIYEPAIEFIKEHQRPSPLPKGEKRRLGLE